MAQRNKTQRAIRATYRVQNPEVGQMEPYSGDGNAMNTKWPRDRKRPTQDGNVTRLLDRLETENERLRAEALELMLQIQALRRK